MPFDDRDSKFERALAQHLRGGPEQANCPDAETLAAYHERNLSLEEMARWKEHISACEACQEALALVETTENQLAEDWEGERVPVFESLSAPRGKTRNAAERTTQAAASPVALIRRRPALLRWAIPLGAVAAGVLVFIGIYEQRTEKMVPSSSAVIARREVPATPVPMGDVQGPSESKDSVDKELETAGRSEQKKEKAILAAPSPQQANGRGSGSGTGFVNVKPDYDAAANKKAATPPPAAPDISAGIPAGDAVSQNAPVRAAAPRPAPPPSASMSYGAAVGGAAGGQKARADAKSAPSAVTESVTVESQAAPIS